MTIKLEDTLLILENLEMSQRCIVLKISLDILMKSIDPNNLKLHLAP